MDTSYFQILIKERCGLVFEDSIKVRLERGICAKMSEKGIGSETDYFNLIFRYQSEFNDLVDLLTVNETYFMREPSHLELMVNRLIPDLLAVKQPGEKIKIISAGCSTGEEPYSIIIKLIEKFGTETRNLFSVIGFDIDSNALRSARKGRYGEHSFRMIDNDMKDKYFIKGNTCYDIRGIVREKVEFHRLNFLDDDYPEVLQGADLIFYRNVSIYFKSETQDKIFRKLADLLNDNGCLILSSTETLAHDTGILSLVELDGIYLFRKNIKPPVASQRHFAGPKEAEIAAPFSRGAETKSGIEMIMDINDINEKGVSPLSPGNKTGVNKKAKDSENTKDREALFNEALSCAEDKKYDEALGKIDELLKASPALVKALTLKASVLINLRRFEEAEGLCLKSVELDQWYLESYLLLGLSAYFRSDLDAALKRFRESLYVTSSCWLAHFYLAEIYRLLDDAATACREYSIVVKILKNGDFQGNGLTYFPLSFSKDHVLHMCEHNLSRLKSQLKAASAENS
jgi:chemotaxis protein methyltransferase CheR